MKVEMTPIGYVRTEAQDLPRHWSLSDVAGQLIIDRKYLAGMQDIRPGGRIVVLFNFHKSPAFTSTLLQQTPPHNSRPKGVFSICSPRRPNPIGLSVVRVTGIEDNVIFVRGLDMLDGTPILDLKPHIEDRHDCPSYKGEKV